jgi:stage IV sporulation protein B
MDVKGVLVVGLEEIKTKSGKTVNPGSDAGLEIGDSILEINGIKVDSAADVRKIVNQIQEEMHLKISRKGKIIYLRLSPVQSAADNLYKIGVWVRDKTAGLGTLTFYNPENNTYGALGHAITDPDTGDLLSIRDGELLSSSVESVKLGIAGIPGEIKGVFYEADEPLGSLKKNTSFGVFGKTYTKIDNPYFQKAISIGYQNEIEEGPAYLLTTLDGNNVKKYKINIDKINHQTKAGVKSMVISVVDPELLMKTGGIVQGMSGSPIIQNEKLIGAVTHVFVNDPTKGYGIFIEWMLQQIE